MKVIKYRLDEIRTKMKLLAAVIKKLKNDPDATEEINYWLQWKGGQRDNTSLSL